MDFAQNRYYNSKHGRFTSTDEPFADQFENNPQSWNLYSYVRNNPLNLTDSFGMAAGCPRGWEGCIERDGKYYWDYGEGEGEIEISPGMVQVDSDDSGVVDEGGSVRHEDGSRTLTVGQALQQQKERREQFVWNNLFALAGHGAGKLFGRVFSWFRGKPTTIPTAVAMNEATITETTTASATSISSKFSTGQLLERTVNTPNYGQVGLLAEVEVQGERIVLKGVSVYSTTGQQIPPGAIKKEIFRATKELVNEFKEAGFKELRIIADRLPSSSSANPGKGIDKVIKLK